MASERGMQIKSWTQGDNLKKADQAEFPILCESCLGETPYVRMQKIPGGGTCKMCERPFTLFKWRPGRGDGYKMTQVCQSCSKVKNLCQTCILDLQFGLPSQLRDAVLESSNTSSSTAPESDVNKEYHNQQLISKMDSSADPWNQETPNEKLLQIARSSNANRDRTVFTHRRVGEVKIVDESSTGDRNATKSIQDSIADKLFDGTIDFIPATEYVGTREGYVFKLDESGLGYYKDPLMIKSTGKRKRTQKFAPKPPPGVPPPEAFIEK